MVQVDVCRVVGIEAGVGPVSVGIGIALAGERRATVAVDVVLDAARVVGDLQAGELDVARALQVEDAPRALGAPQLGRVGAAGVPARAQDARRGGWAGAAGDGRHMTAESPLGRPNRFSSPVIILWLRNSVNYLDKLLLDRFVPL